MSRLLARERELHLIVAWRAERLMGLGMKPALALELARNVDWHQLAQLLGIPR